MTETDNETGESTSTGLPSDVLNIELEYSGDQSNSLCCHDGEFFQGTVD